MVPPIVLLVFIVINSLFASYNAIGICPPLLNGTCTRSHPWAYSYGEACCSEQEGCDKSRFTLTSTCCNGATVECTSQSGKCSNFEADPMPPIVDIVTYSLSTWAILMTVFVMAYFQMRKNEEAVRLALADMRNPHTMNNLDIDVEIKIAPHSSLPLLTVQESE